MAYHHHHVAHMPRNDDIQTVVSIVYVTASATFDGPIGGYTTLLPELETLSSTVSTESSTTSTSGASYTTHHVGTPLRHTRTTATTRVTVTASPESSSSTESSSSKTVPIRSQRPGSVASSASVDTSSVFAASSTADAQSTTLFVSTTAATSSVAVAQVTSTADLDPTKHADDMSSGSKAGTAIGVLLAVGLIFALGFLFYRRSKAQDGLHEQLDDENSEQKHSRNSTASRFSFRQSFIRAPRLSLGPLNHIFPALSLEKPTARNNSTDSSNPFGDHAETIVDEKNHPMLPQTGPSAAAIVPKPLTIKSERSNSPLPSPGRPGPAQAGPPPSNVHRVQLDFKPSMDDELELRTGQLVRMLHEYDDGWALCIRLDRSQQGVVPRTCISKLALKPRPAGPPMQGRPGHRASPAGSLSSTSSFASDESTPHPLSPASGRMRSQTGPQSDGQYNGDVLDNRPRANSAGSAVGVSRVIPAGMSPLNPTSTHSNGSGLPIRKPVPGQAL